MTSKVIYQGNLRTLAEHVKSGNTVITDAPTDNNGKGEYFSPTDLVATALGSCMLTLMGIKAQSQGYDLQNLELSIEKVMESAPRRIGKVVVNISCTDLLSAAQIKSLEQTALNCPVAKSLDPKIIQEVSFNWINSK